MQSDVPKGVEYSQKQKLNILKKEMEEMQRRQELVEFKQIEEERLKKVAQIDPKTAAMNAEFLKYFMEGL